MRENKRGPSADEETGADTSIKKRTAEVSADRQPGEESGERVNEQALDAGDDGREGTSEGISDEAPEASEARFNKETRAANHKAERKAGDDAGAAKRAGGSISDEDTLPGGQTRPDPREADPRGDE
jgi:hypothetical protein